MFQLMNESSQKIDFLCEDLLFLKKKVQCAKLERAGTSNMLFIFLGLTQLCLKLFCLLPIASLTYFIFLLQSPYNMIFLCSYNWL